MKQLFLGIALLLCCYSKGFGQFQIHPDSSFYTFLDSFYTYYQDDSTEGGIYNKVRRDVLTWGTRLAPTGNMQRANKAMLDYSRIYTSSTIATTNLVTGTIPIVFPTNYPGFPSPWTELGPTKNIHLGNSGKGMGQIHRLAFHPNYNGVSNQILYAGSHYGGLYRTDDAGDNWYNFHTDRGLPMTSIGGVAVSANRVFVCTGNGDHGYADFGVNAHYDPLRGAINGANPIHTQGVYFIEDNGVSTQWNPINGVTRMINDSLAGDLLTVFEQGGTMRNIIVNPLDDHILLIATSQGVFRTENRGNTWKQVVVGSADPSGGFILDTEWRGLEYHPTDTNIVYASGKDIYKSIDGGRTWSSISNSQLTLPFNIARINIAVSPAASNHLYAYVIGGGKGHVYLYDGTNWHLQNNLFNQLSSTPDWAAIAVSPTNPQIVYVGGVKARSSTNISTSGGATFGAGHIGTIHDDIHVFEYSPDTATTELFVGTHGGVSKSAGTGSAPFTALYDGLGVATIWAFDDFEGNDSLLSLAQQDVGTNVTIDKGNSWAQLRGEDGYGTRIDNQTGDIYALGNYATGLQRLTLEPYSYVPTIFYEGVGIPEGGAPSTYPAETHPKNDSLYFGFSELYLRARDVSADSLIYLDTFTLGTTLPGSGASTNVNNCADLNTHPSKYIGIWVQPGGGGTGPQPGGYCIVKKYTTILEKWEKKSNLESFQVATIDRRIQELAFSEDASNYTYVATLGDSRVGARRADFYVNNADSLGCDTCFVIKTNNLPIDSIAQALTFDPNPITGLAVDPLDGRRVWASFSGYSKDIKVYYSEDAGDTWTSYDDMQNSLANLNVPINNIVYQRGTNDRLYIATDVGIYVREGMGNWLRYGDDFPNVRTTELKINYCSGKLRAATFGRGAWEADLLPTENAIDYRSFRTITGIERWETNKNMVRDIKVQAGAILILDSITLNMPKDGLIVVEPGGLLVVDSSTITNLCGETWQGIQVWGNSNLSQVPSNQGQIIVHASTLEYAQNAISPWEVGNFPNPSTGTGGTGGIIVAQNSTFLNNWRSIDFMRYLPPSGGIERSTLEGCTFTVNDDYRSFNGDTIPFFLGHISMWSVGGTSIKGCTFEDERTNKIGDVTTGGSYGLLGLGASPKLSRLLLPSKRNRFMGLERAVELGGGNSTNPTTSIDECTFVDNEQAIIIRAHNNAVIIRDSFVIGGFVSGNPNSYFVEEYGLGLINSTSFNVEQNYFRSNNNDQTVGSWVEASGSGGNAIRNNEYDNLTGGNLAHGHNGRDSVNLFGGLEYHCNQNINNDYDFTVLANITSNAAPASIKSTQGRISQACRNTFSASVQAFPSQAHFYNYNTTAGQLGAPVRYYYTPNNTNEIPDAALLFNTNRQVAPQGILSFCAENYTGTGTFKVTNGEGETVSLAALKENYTTDLEYYNLLKGEYDEIPEEDSTTRSNKASELAGSSQKLFFWANQVIQYYANDTILQNDSLETWIQKKPGVEAQYELVEHYWRQGRYNDALDQIDYIGTTYSLDSLALKNHGHYKDLKELLQTAYDNGRMEANLEKREVNKLEDIANAKWGFAAVLASDILKFFYFKGTQYYPTLPNMNPIEGRYVQASDNNPAISSTEPVLMGAPNPAINWVDLYYELPEELNTGHLIVTSTTGAIITQVELRNNSGQITLNTKNWVSGIYFATLFSEGQETKTFKIVIQK